jgi:acid phosphatase class B
MDLGGNELIEILDGIYPTQRNEKNVIRWVSLDNHWCSGMLVSQDPIAIQSVGVDLLSNKPNVTKGNPSFTPDLDNFLHESALADNPPSGFRYDPENNGKYIKQSLGVHEYWNNPKDKKYRRNLGTGRGIELVYINGVSSK